MLGCGTNRLVSTHLSKPRVNRQAVRIQAAAASSGAEAGGNPIGEAITKTYGAPYLKRATVTLPCIVSALQNMLLSSHTDPPFVALTIRHWL